MKCKPNICNCENAQWPPGVSNSWVTFLFSQWECAHSWILLGLSPRWASDLPPSVNTSVYSVELVFRYNFLDNSVWCDQVPYSYETFCGIQAILTGAGVIIFEDDVRNHLSQQFASLGNDPIRNFTFLFEQLNAVRIFASLCNELGVKMRFINWQVACTTQVYKTHKAKLL